MSEEEPIFPNHSNKINLNNDSFGTPGAPVDDWQTTYDEFNKKKNVSAISLRNDTSKLQQTHWVGGNEATNYQSEMKANYIPHPIENSNRSQRTRDQLMRSSYTFNDGFPMETRASLAMQKYGQSDLQQNKPARSNSELQRSHFNYQDANSNKWTTTSGSSYVWRQGEPAKPQITEDLRAGSGMRESMNNQSSFNVIQSETQSQYKAPSRERLIEQREAIHTKDLTRTTHQFGNYKNDYETTNKHDFVPLHLPQQDYDKMKEQKRQLARSNFDVGNPNAHTENSSYTETFVPIEGNTTEEARQMRLRNSQASLVSHHDFRNCNETFHSSSQDAYVPLKTQEPQKALQLNLQQTHVKLGEDNVHEMKSLYSDTFQYRAPERRSQSSLADEQKANSRMMRDFHTQHHTKVTTVVGLEDNKTTNQATYVPHPDAKPRQPIRFDDSSMAVSMADPTLIVKQSTMKTDYVPLHAKPSVPVSNQLQQSHIQFGNMANDWRTTQKDYFQFKTYRIK